MRMNYTAACPPIFWRACPPLAELKIFSFLLLVFLACHTKKESSSWMVLLDAVQPSVKPIQTSTLVDTVLSYPQIFEGHLIHSEEDSSKWIVFQLQKEKAYLPIKAIVLLRTDSQPFQIDSIKLTEVQFPLPLSYKPANLRCVSQRWNFHQKDYPKYLRMDAVLALEKMLSAAEKTGAHLRILSAFRSPKHQRRLYLQSLEEDHGNLISTAKPGYSEHQLGLVVDLCNLNPKSAFYPDFDSCVEGKWLKANAKEFGFEQSYTQENMHETGVIPEPWHYRYIGEIR